MTTRLEQAEAAFIAATRHLDRLRVSLGLEHLSAKDLAAGLDNGREGSEQSQAKGQGEGDPATHGESPSEYQRFYDFVAECDPAIIDAWHFGENNRPGGLAERVRLHAANPHMNGECGITTAHSDEDHR